MRLRAVLFPLLAVVLALSGCQQAPTETSSAEEMSAAEADPTPGAIVATGVLRGRSGTPLAEAQLVFGEVIREMLKPSKVNLGPAAHRVTTDAEGRFRIEGFQPGEFGVVYLPADSVAVIPLEVNVAVLGAAAKSFAPLLRGVEMGRDGDYEERPWSNEYTLLAGHTLYNHGELLNAWNATARLGSQGPFVELRNGELLMVNLEDNCELELEAWSF